MKALLLMLLLAMTATAAPVFTLSERAVVSGSFQKLAASEGFAIDESYLKIISTETEFEILFGSDPSKEIAKAGIVFAKPGVNVIYINTWKPLWSNLTDSRLMEDKERLETAQVVMASLMRFSLETITGGAGGKGTTSELAAHKAELALLLRYQKQGVKFLEVPIKETQKEIKRLEKLEKSGASSAFFIPLSHKPTCNPSWHKSSPQNNNHNPQYCIHCSW